MTAHATIFTVLLDVNHMVDALKGRPVPQSVEELLFVDSAVAAVAATDKAALLGSEHCLDLLEHVLQRELCYSEHQAALVADLYYAVTEQSGGSWITAEQGRAAAETLNLPALFLGDNKGQIDFEDLQVLGAALHQAQSGPVAIVTRDGGLHNIGHAMAEQRVQIVHAHTARVALQAIRNQRR